ncbi:probable disease resistance protein At5g66900 [Syzygium oleosum]|uniref:probable disease resistance protein At5g66900 n=1 Tax=Syzygium oleosum TaxID=219896 RepID=UPI0011D1A6F7|nr:probable disease resistance protein At5g66900 [Syzygium oleosum]
MPIDVAGAAVGMAFGELLALVKNVLTTVAAFRPQLKNIESTLRTIEPIINEIDRCNTLLDRPRGMDRIKELLDEGKRLVNKCSGTSRLHMSKQYKLSNELTGFLAALKSEIDIYMVLLITRDVMLMRLKLEELTAKIEAKDHSGEVYGEALQSGPGSSRRHNEQERPVDFAAAAVETAFRELLELVKNLGKTVAAFGGQLKKIESTLSSIGPIINEIDKFNNLLDRPQEMGRIENLLKQGEGLVNKCSKIHKFNLWMKYTHSKKLTNFNAEVVEKFQIYMPLVNARNGTETLVELKRIGGDVKKVKESISVIVNTGALQSGFEASGNLAVPAAPHFIVGSEVEASLRKLKEQLLEEGVSVIAVTAPGGCGKTTLLKKLCHDAAIKGKFKAKIMFVPVSKKPNLIDIVQKMYQHNQCKVPVIETEDDAVRCLHQLLNAIGQDPVLLVLDDVWTGSESFIMNFICNDLRDYKIVVTSRYEFPAFRPVHHLNPLTHDEAVELFRRCVTVDDRSVDAPDDKLLDQIVKLCNGLPLALTVVAETLRGADRSFWQITLLELAKGHFLSDSENDILDYLKKSLDDLDGEPWVKERFMDLGSFPKDRMISTTALIDMWVELYNLDCDGMRAINDLHRVVYRNLANLVVSRKDSSDDNEYYSGHYTMQHYMLRELAIRECNEAEIEKRERIILELIGNSFPGWWSEQKQQPLCARLVSISTDKTFSTPWPNLELPKAEALVLNFQTYEQTESYALPEFIEKADKLKVLIVTNYGFLPAELHNFHVIGSNLRRIRLEHVMVSFLNLGKLRLHSLRKISFFMCNISQASMPNDAKISDAMPTLEELDIDYCNYLVTLPDCICQIKTLRKLSITNCPDFYALPEQIGLSASLEVVRLNSCTNLSQLPDSIGSLQKLRFLNISDCNNLSTLPDQIGQMVNLQKIHMRGCLRLSVLPPTIVKLRNLRKVFCEKEKAVLWGPLKSSLNVLNIIASEEEASLDWLRD